MMACDLSITGTIKFGRHQYLRTLIRCLIPLVLYLLIRKKTGWEVCLSGDIDIAYANYSPRQTTDRILSRLIWFTMRKCAFSLH